MIKICNDRSVFPNSVKVSNQYENDTRSIDFDLSDVQFTGNTYLICKYQGQSTFYAPLLLDSNFSIPVETFLSAQPGAYTCVIVISTVTIDADYNFSSDNPLFVSNEFTLNVDPNFLTGTATAWELTPAAQNYFDQLIALVDKVQEDLDSGAFVGNGIKSITLISTVGLVDTYQILFTDGLTFDFQVTNGATPTITIENGIWFVNGISTGVSALGQKGDKGDPGVGIVSVEKTSTSGNVDTYTITFTNQTTSTFTVTNGTNGKDGVTPNIQIGTVTTLPAGSQATATITGTTENPLLNLGIPQGETGGTTNYNDLENKPQINGVELSGNKSGNDVGLVNNQQGAENNGKILGIGPDGIVTPVKASSGNKLVGEVLLAEYTHQGNQEIHFSDFDWATATGTTTEPHGLTETTPVQVVPDGWVNNFGGNQTNVTKTMCSIPIEWMMYNGIIYLLPVNENQVKVVKNDKTSPITVNPNDTPSNDLINFSLFHFEIPIGVDIQNLNSAIDIKKIKVSICGVGSRPKNSRYLLVDSGYYITIQYPPALSNNNNIYQNFIYEIEANIDNTQSIKPICNSLIKYASQRKGYNIFVGDKKEESYFQLQTYIGNQNTFNRFRILDNYAFLTNGTSVRICAVEGEYNES